MSTPYICQRCCRRLLPRIRKPRVYSTASFANRAEEHDEEKLAKPLRSFGALGWGQKANAGKNNEGIDHEDDKVQPQSKDVKEDYLSFLFNSGNSHEQARTEDSGIERGSKGVRDDPLWASSYGRRPREPQKEASSTYHKKRDTKEDDALESLFSTTSSHEQSLMSRYSRQAIGESRQASKWGSKSTARVMQPMALQASSELGVEDDDKYHTMTEGLMTLKRQLMNDQLSLETIWKSCLAIVESDTWKRHSASENVKYHEGGSVFLHILLAIARRGWIVVEGKRFTPRDVITIYRDNGAFKFWWDHALWAQLSSLLEVRPSQNTDSATLHVFAERLATLLQTWDFFFDSFRMHEHYKRKKALHHRAKDESHGGKDASEPSDQPMRLPPRLSKRFEHLFGFRTHLAQGKRIASASILTLHYLELHIDKLKVRAAQLSDVLTLREGFRLLDQNVIWDCDSLVSCLKHAGTSSEALDAVKAEWLGSHVQSIRGSPLLLPPREKSNDPQFSLWTPQQVDDFFTETDRITKGSDSSAATKLWQNVKSSIGMDQLKDPDLRSKIFARFLRLFFEVRLNDKAIDVWNHMISIGLRPQTKHWTAMLAGCSSVRDATSMQGIWTNMLNAGVEPDTEAWGAYIHGTIKAGKQEEGLELLQRLGRVWKSKKSLVRPALGPIHSALSALRKTSWGRASVVRMQNHILDWARSEGLQPTTYTYNIMLQTINISATPQEIHEFLRKMSEDDCQPDIITYTIILKGLVRSYNSPFFSLSQEDQVTAIDAIIKSLQADNINPSPHTYSTLLFGLLDSREHPANVLAAQHLLSHMETANIEPSPQVTTILVTHYFHQKQPNITAVEALIASATRDPKRRHALGHFFWNRVIRGYAECDEWEKALYYLRNRPLEKHDASWTVLWKLLQALGRAKEWDLCAEVVDGVESGKTMKYGGSGVGGAGHQAYMQEVDQLRSQGLIAGQRQAEEVVKSSGWGMEKRSGEWLGNSMDLGGFYRE